MIGALAVDPCGIPIRRPHEDHIRRRHPLADESESVSTAPAPRIALIHATRLSMAPIEEAVAARWPEAGRFHLLEEALSADRVHAPAGAASMAARFVALSRYAQMAGADGILYTCSAFGAEIEAARRAVPLPTLKPNEAMLEEALAIGSRIGLVATFEPSLGSIGDELRTLARERGVSIAVTPVFAPDAMAALGRGDAAAHDRKVADAARSLASSVDVVLLAQFSMARARPAAASVVAVPVLTSPDSAVDALRRAMSAAATSPPGPQA
jgi:Asp/Glu/hydantoin racemase